MAAEGEGDLLLPQCPCGDTAGTEVEPVISSLYNTLGQQVWAEILGKTKKLSTTIPVTNLANGVYILKVNSGETSVQKEVVVAR